jgi:hypothetical protein
VRGSLAHGQQHVRRWCWIRALWEDRTKGEYGTGEVEEGVKRQTDRQTGS